MSSRTSPFLRIARLSCAGRDTPPCIGNSGSVSSWTSCEAEQAAEFDRLFAVRRIFGSSETITCPVDDGPAGLGSSAKPATASGHLRRAAVPHQSWAAVHCTGSRLIASSSHVRVRE